MPDRTDLRRQIAEALAAFADPALPLAGAATALFDALGYRSQKRLALTPNTPDNFLATFAQGRPFNAQLALTADWQSVDFLFQFTDEEVRAAAGGNQQFLFDSRGQYNGAAMESYLFFAIALKQPHYTRTALAGITRAVNRLFPMPVLLLFRHGDTLTLAVISRRLHKRDEAKDVLEKVTLIKDIRFASPHRAHIEILYDLSFDALRERHDFTNFVQLHEAWRSTLDTSALTKDFYTEIAKWYFWAREHATFPKDAPVDADGKPSLPLIRLLTRLVFCWFLREKTNPQTGKGLLPDDLFTERGIQRLLKDASPDACTYYPAILQNLFFATLNIDMGDARRFIDEGDGQRSDDHMIHSLWRHARLLRDPEALAALLRDVPFLNGGLFECLDDRVPRGTSAFTDEIRIDGFSNDPRKQPKLPNFLFFGPEQTVNLAAAYGADAPRRETVRPLLAILHRYKFTLTENTPIEQEVALDPELLGHVFENLLAAYNPETGTVARKATGSFYTPRVVVDWMVDQALLIYLGQALARANRTTPPDPPDERLRQLLSWEETRPEFSPAETDALIDALDHLKALDPACGSGAFPMGLLQKLVHVLRKLDPQNQAWRRRQEAALDRFDSAPAREEARRAIERAFARDNDDYGRKLYLIENCLYGVDIQPIACQIAKLRFFIALIVDQTIDPQEPNYGILPLPNLETKIVAANTLLGLQRGQLLLGSDRVRQLEQQLQQVRHDYFTARRYKDKKALRARDRELCAQLAAALTESGECSPYDAKRLAAWNPYDTNQAAPFFDPAWMFGLSGTDGGAGNPVRDHQQTGLSALPSIQPFNPEAEVHKTHRRLPHWTQEGRTYFVTFRLADSLPQDKLQEWLEERDIWLKHHPEPWSERDWAEYDERFGQRFESWLDAGEGECHLRRPEIRALVESCLRHLDGQRYDLAAYVVMPNHVHLLICPREGFALADILKGIKGVSAREANKRLGRQGTFWQEESFDHIVRSQAQFDRFLRYIADNPVKARLREGEYGLFQRGTGNPACGPEQTGVSALPGAGNLACERALAQTGLSAPPFDLVLGNPPYVRQEQLKNVTVTGSDGRPRPLKDVLKEQYDCYTGTADLYVYFFERALQLLRLGGVLSFITSNKYLRATYGERLRTYLFYATHPRVILDFGETPVFTAIVEPCIYIATKGRQLEHNQLPDPAAFALPDRLAQLVPDRSLRVHTWNPESNLDTFPDLFANQAHPLAQRDLRPDGWRLESPVKLRLLERLRAAGQPLGDYVKGRFYYGIKTGLNEAFVVDRATRDRLIAEHPSSAEVLKPFLRGRDVKRWRCDFGDQYLIKIESSENKQHPWSGKGKTEAERIFAKTYPAIHAWFETMRQPLIKRYDQGQYFWELRSCDYWREFEQPKIVYQEINRTDAFAYDPDGFYLNNKLFMLPGQGPWLLGILCSQPLHWFIRKASGAIEGAFLGMQWPFMKTLPIPPATPPQQALLERLVEALIWLHGQTGLSVPQSSTGNPACVPEQMGVAALPRGAGNPACTPPPHPRDPLLRQFLEQLVNALVYELFFPAELHARRLKFFDLLARSGPPDVKALPAARRLEALRAWFEPTWDIQSLLRAALHDLAALEVVRIIEDKA